MKKSCLRITLECIGLQLVFAVVSFGLYTDFIPASIFSVFTAWLFIWSIHSTFWQLGNKERKRVIIINRNLAPDESPIKNNIFKGALIGLPFFAINLIFLVLTCILNEDIFVTIQSILQFAFVGFLSPVDDNLGYVYFMPRFIVCLTMYAVCIGAYISGSMNYSFLDKYFRKIIYKSKKEDD